MFQFTSSAGGVAQLMLKYHETWGVQGADLYSTIAFLKCAAPRSVTHLRRQGLQKVLYGEGQTLTLRRKGDFNPSLSSNPTLKP